MKTTKHISNRKRKNKHGLEIECQQSLANLLLPLEKKGRKRLTVGS